MSRDPADRSLQGDLFAADSAAPGSGRPHAHAARPQPSQPPPFRVQPMDVGDAELQGLNREQGLKGARAYRATPEAQHMASTAQTMNDDRLLSFVLHPSELVPIALLSNDNQRKPWEIGHQGVTRGKWLRDVLYQRATQQAARDGHHWTPLLDALAASRIWPRPIDPTSYQFNMDGTPYADQPQPLAGSAQHLADRLIPWVGAQQDPRALDPLWGFRFDPIRRIVCEHATCLDSTWLNRILAEPANGYWLARNPHLTDSQVRDEIVAWALGLLDQRASPYCTGARKAADTLIEMEAAGRPLEEPAIEALLTLVPPWEPSTTHSRYNLRPRSWDGTSRGSALSVLLESASTRPEHLLRLYGAARHEHPTVEAIVRHPSANLDVWRHVIEDTSHFPVRDYLSSLPEARRDPAIRRVLARSTSNSVLADLCLDAEPEEFSRLFARIRSTNAVEALALLGHEQFDSRVAALAALRPLAEEEEIALPKSYRRHDRPTPSAFRLSVLLRLHGKPLADDPPGHEGTTSASYAEGHLRPLLRRLIAEDPARVARLIEERHAVLRSVLEPADLAPLLQSDDHRVRLAAVLALGDWGTAAEPDRPVRAAPRST